MCGIVGYIGKQQALPILIDGLEKLEYRGYDSAGVAIVEDGALQLRKKKGRLSVLAEDVQQHPMHGCLGIGHTRWATHGAPSDENAHPHVNTNKTIALVHNGIIENHVALRKMLEEKGVMFLSETDTETAVHLIDLYYEGDLLAAVKKARNELVGSYALCVISTEHPDEMIVVRKDSPIVIGVGEGENYVASDIPALLSHTREVYFLEDGEVARVTANDVTIYGKDDRPVTRELFHVDWNIEAAERGGYAHFMQKEIYEEPRAIRDTLYSRLDENQQIQMDDIGLTKEMVGGLRRIVIVACGTAYHAGIAGKYLIERLVGIPVEVDIASEFRYRQPPIAANDLFVAISQSGETADTLAALRLAKQKGAHVLAVSNVVGSTISREADAVMYTMAGPEIAVASTKAYVTQVVCMVLLTLAMGQMRGTIAQTEYQELLKGLLTLPDQAETLLSLAPELERLAQENRKVQDAYFMGRNLDYGVSMEASLKLKEISYVHSEAFAAGELKHGPIALIEDGTLSIVTATQPELYEKTASNIKEIKARGARVIAICPADAAEVRHTADLVIDVPMVHPLLRPILAVIPAQIFAYYSALARDLDVDKPRNLAKSVTVE